VSLPVCTTVGGYVDARAGAKLSLPVCTTVGGSVDASENAKLSLPVCTTVGGSVYAIENAKLSLPVCTTVGGYVDAREGANLSLPVCTTVGGYVSARAGANLSLPVCTTVGGYVYARENAKVSLPVCTTVGGYVDARAGAKLSLPVCTTVGGSVDAREGAKLSLPVCVKKDFPGAGQQCQMILQAAFLDGGFSFADGVLAKIVATRGNVSRVIICGKVAISYHVSDGENYSHGATLAEARDGLLYKIGSRDTTEFKAWKLDQEISRRDGIRAYRAITGACEGGVRQWMQSHQVPDKLTVASAIKLTTGAYGSQGFAKFFTGKDKCHS